MASTTLDSRIAARRPPAVPRISSAGAGALVALLLALATGSPALAQDRQGPVKIGVLAKRGPERCLEKWGPTAEHLTSQVPGHSFTIVPLDFDEVDPAVERGDVDFILANSSFYVTLELRYGTNRIATLKNRPVTGAYTIFGGVIFRRADREDIQDLCDLKGKTFMAVKETSLGGWHAGWRELRKHGIDPHRDLTDLQFGGTHDAVVYAVRDGKVDAGTVRTDTLERMAAEGTIRLEDLHALGHDHVDQEICEFPFLHSTDVYPEWPFAKVAHTSDELAEKVAVALIGMPADSPAAEAARCAGWTVPLNYQPVHECLRELRVSPYKDYGKVTFGDVLRQYWPWIVSATVLLAGMAVTVAWALLLLSARKRAEEAVRRSEEKHRVLIEHLPQRIFCKDRDSVYVSCNDNYAKDLGIKAEEIVGKTDDEFYSRELAERYRADDRRLMASGGIEEIEEQYVRDGQRLVVQTVKTPVTNENGDVTGVLGIFWDVTERKRAEQELAEAHRSVAQEAHKLRSMIEGMDEGIVVADADDIITEVNQWFLDKAGMDRDDIVGKSLWKLHPDTEGTARIRAVLESFRSGQRREMHGVNRELLGMQLSLRVQPIFDDERYRGVILNAVNVTDLVEARQAAEAATRVKSEFLANMSHEIRTPMTAILGFTETMLDSDISDSERLNAVHTVRRNGEHLLQIINDILDISKIEAGKLEVECIRCSPVRVVADVKSLMQIRADAKGLPFNIEYEGAIPETIQSDPMRLKQILVNLIGNAINFTETGGVRLVTRLVNVDGGSGTCDQTTRTQSATANGQSSIVNRQSSMLQFDVIDTGIGMTEQQVGRLFQAFTQADASTTRKFGGTGLGLMISKRLAEMLGGDITVESKPGEGSTFRVTITTGSLDGVKMIADPLAATVLTPETSAAPSADQPVLHDCRILLVEDGPDNQRLIVHVLKKAGAEVTVKENGRLAADAVLAAMNRRREGDPERPFDVILMDMQMPVMDGYEATGLLRQKGYAGPIIALTAHAMASDRQKCIDAGCDDYANKPINRRKLIETIQEWLRKDTARSARPGERANSPVQNSFSGPVHAA